MPPKRKAKEVVAEGSKKRKKTSSPVQQSSSDKSKHLGDSDFLSSSAYTFRKQDTDALNIAFKPANEDEVIPAYRGALPNFPELYVLPDVNRGMLSTESFDIDAIQSSGDGGVKIFISKLHDVTLNERVTVGTKEAVTDTMVDDLLRIVDFNWWPLKLIIHPIHRIFVQGDPIISSMPEFVVNRADNAMKKILLVVDDKHLKNVDQSTGWGETQIAAEILACADENRRSIEETEEEDDGEEDQTMFAIRVISTHVTFYKATISGDYWKELDNGMPENESLKILRWPRKNGVRTGLDLADPESRREILSALVKLREFFLLDE